MKELISIGLIPKPVNHIAVHSHDMWEFVYYIYGTGTINVGNNEIGFEPGLMICLPPNISHCENSVSGYRNYHFSVRCFDGFGTQIPVFSDNESKDCLNIFTQIYREYHLKQNNWRNITESLLTVLYNYMVAWSNIIRQNPLVEKFCNLLVSNISNPNFSIEETLSGIHLSPDHFRKLFKKETGMTPLEYLIQKRIDYARELLSLQKINRYKIKEVAILCGFDDQYYFSRLFKKVTGFSPAEYRKSIIESNL